MNRPRLLVTGATGFLGRPLVRALLERGHAVRALGRNAEAGREIAALGAEFVRADLRDREAIAAACADMRVVLHVGALSAPWGDASEFHTVNVDGTRHVIDGSRRHGVARLLFVSSPSVAFDGGDQIDATESAPAPRRYLCTYSRTKQLAEELVRAAGRAGLETVILRPKAIFGPGDTTLLPRLLEAAREQRLPQIGDGSNRVDVTYVDNVVAALALAIDAPAAAGRTYTITNGEHVRLWDLIRRILDQLGMNSRLRALPYRVAYALAAGMELRSRITGGEPRLTRYTTAILGRSQTYDIAAARRDLGYSPAITVDEGVERTIAALQGSPSRA